MPESWAKASMLDQLAIVYGKFMDNTDVRANGMTNSLLNAAIPKFTIIEAKARIEGYKIFTVVANNTDSPLEDE